MCQMRNLKGDTPGLGMLMLTEEVGELEQAFLEIK